MNNGNTPKAIKGRKEDLKDFNLEVLAKDIYSAALDIGGRDENKAREMAQVVGQKLYQEYGNITTPDQIEEIKFKTLIERGYEGTAWAGKIRSKRKEKARSNLQVLGSKGKRDSTDSFLMVGSSSRETATGWDRKRIIISLINEANLDLRTAESVSEEVETNLFSGEVPQITTQLIRETAHTELIRRNLREASNLYKNFGMPRADLEQLINNKNKENSNVAGNNPEAINFTIAGGILKAYALSNVFSEDIAEAHTNGALHLHDLDMVTRLYCSAHSLEYLKKYGLKLKNLSSSSGPPKHAETLIGHLNTFLASMQTYYAGALGVGDINVFFAPHLKKDLERKAEERISVLRNKLEKDKKNVESKRVLENISQLERLMTEDEQKIKEYESNPLAILDDKTIDDYLEQQAQKLLYQGSQNAFSRGGQTLFLDFNVHVGVPKHLKDTLIILDGKYQLQDKNGKLIALEERKLEEKTRSEYNLMELIDPRTKEVVLKERIEMIGGGEGKKGKEHIIQDSFTKEGEKVAVYGDYNGIAKRFTKALLKKFGDGDEKGAPFAFPKCDFHINEEVIEGKDKEAEEIFDYACQVASKNGSVYFVMDRDDVTMSACCRLRTTIDDDYVLKHPESMRFCGFQNVTINLPQAAYRAAKKGKKNLEGFLEEIDLTMDLARKAHQEKKAYIEELQKPGGPQYQTGAPSLDGQKYVDLNKATYIIGLLGLNDALNFLTGKELHEMTGEELKNWGLKTVSHMNNQARRYSEEDNLNYSLEESPAESATRRMSLVDLSLFPEAKDYVKGNLKTGDTYYTNSIHEAADAPDDLITRIKKQGMFHPAITSGAITHAFVGEHLPPAASIKNLVTKTFKETQTAQLTISPEFTVCESCKTTHNGIYESCPKCKSEEIYTMSRIVGYFSQIPNWNRSKLVELKARQKARENYSVPVEIRDTNGMPVLASFVNGEDFTGHIYGKPGCGTCQDLKEKTMQHIIGRYEKKGVKINMVYHNVFTDDEMTDFLTAGLNPSRLPALVVIDRKGNEVYRQETRYNADGRGKAELITAGSIVRGLEEHAGPEK